MSSMSLIMQDTVIINVCYIQTPVHALHWQRYPVKVWLSQSTVSKFSPNSHNEVPKLFYGFPLNVSVFTGLVAGRKVANMLNSTFANALDSRTLKNFVRKPTKPRSTPHNNGWCSNWYDEHDGSHDSKGTVVSAWSSPIYSNSTARHFRLSKLPQRLHRNALSGRLIVGSSSWFTTLMKHSRCTVHLVHKVGNTCIAHSQ